jgi:hypothetical protein
MTRTLALGAFDQDSRRERWRERVRHAHEAGLVIERCASFDAHLARLARRAVDRLLAEVAG